MEYSTTNWGRMPWAKATSSQGVHQRPSATSALRKNGGETVQGPHHARRNLQGRFFHRACFLGSDNLRQGGGVDQAERPFCRPCATARSAAGPRAGRRSGRCPDLLALVAR